MRNAYVKPAAEQRLVLLIMAFFVLLVVIGLPFLGSRTHLDWPTLQEAIRNVGGCGILICILLYIVFTLCFIPTTPLSLIVGATYGVFAGTVYASIGTLTGATLAFLISRYLLHRPIRRWIGDSRTFRWIDDGVQRDAWRIIIISRMFPITPYNFLNYAYGLTSVPLAKYMIASWLGLLPPIIAWIWTAAAAGQIALGHADKRIFVALLVGTAFFALIGYLPRLVRKRFPPPA